ncbi:MAG TPA: arginine--tRNA ligase, partial [Gammaproteobacteria bacterium]|nr:arginine--tRNA ligase [Gammaproteobacteria bacterium]
MIPASSLYRLPFYTISFYTVATYPHWAAQKNALFYAPDRDPYVRIPAPSIIRSKFVKQALAELVKQALQALQQQGTLAADCPLTVRVENSKSPKHGTFSSNIALTLAGTASLPPRQLAEQIVTSLPVVSWLQKTDIAGPGFINFFLETGAQFTVIDQILDGAEYYGHNNHGKGQAVMVEFVSANPTGPLHVGHGRGAAYGDTLARLLKATGYQVATEYYVNDAGRQMAILALSVWLRYLELCG